MNDSRTRFQAFHGFSTDLYAMFYHCSPDCAEKPKPSDNGGRELFMIKQQLIKDACK